MLRGPIARRIVLRVNKNTTNTQRALRYCQYGIFVQNTFTLFAIVILCVFGDQSLV